MIFVFPFFHASIFPSLLLSFLSPYLLPSLFGLLSLLLISCSTTFFPSPPLSLPLTPSILHSHSLISGPVPCHFSAPAFCSSPPSVHLHSVSSFLSSLLILPPVPFSFTFILLPLSDVSLWFDLDNYGDTEDLSQIRFQVQRTTPGGALSTLVNPIEIRVIPVTLDNFNQMRYPPPPDFPSEQRAESK